LVDSTQLQEEYLYITSKFFKFLLELFNSFYSVVTLFSNQLFKPLNLLLKMMERLLGALAYWTCSNDVEQVETVLHQTKVIEGVSLDVKAMDSGRGSVEKENVW